MLRRNLSSVPLALAALLAFCLPASAEVKGTFERTLTVTGPVDLEVGSGSGDIIVRDGAAGRVRIVGHVSASGWLFWSPNPSMVRDIEQNPPIRQTGNRIVIGSAIRKWNNVGISYEVEAPADLRLRATTGSGSLQISGVRGPVNLSTGSGDINAERIGNTVDARTGSGSIRVDNADGAVNGSTGSGDISVSAASGDVAVTTGSGSLRVRASRGSVRGRTGSGDIHVDGAARDLDVHTGSGSLVVEGDPGASRWKLETGSGDVNVRLPPRSSFAVDAHSGSGGVQSKHSVTTQGRARENELKGVAGNGVAQLFIRTGSGGIQID